MTIWDSYPLTYRTAEVQAILRAVHAGESVALIGLSGAGKSNLMGFVFYRVFQQSPAAILVDANRAAQKTAAGLYQLARVALEAPLSPAGEFPALEAAIAERLRQPPGSLSLLIDRFDSLLTDEQTIASGNLRALRDAHKYALTLVIASRRPPDPNSELAELFYANTLWLGPLAHDDALWSAGQYAARRSQSWDTPTLERLIEITRGYPSFLRAACEALAAGCPLDAEALRAHPAVQQRVAEFWADQPTADALRKSGLEGHPFLLTERASMPELTASEHRLLVYFQAHPAQVCEKDDLIRAVWPEEQLLEGLRDDSLAQLVRRLRQKIEPDAANPRHILTVPGRGYRYQP